MQPQSLPPQRRPLPNYLRQVGLPGNDVMMRSAFAPQQHLQPPATATSFVPPLAPPNATTTAAASNDDSNNNNNMTTNLSIVSSSATPVITTNAPPSINSTVAPPPGPPASSAWTSYVQQAPAAVAAVPAEESASPNPNPTQIMGASANVAPSSVFAVHQQQQQQHLPVITPEMEASLVAAVSCVRLVRRVYRGVLRPQLLQLKQCIDGLRAEFVGRANEVFRTMRLCSAEARQMADLAALESRRAARMVHESRCEQRSRSEHLESEAEALRRENVALRGEVAALRDELSVARANAEEDVARLKRTYRERLLTLLTENRMMAVLGAKEEEDGRDGATATSALSGKINSANYLTPAISSLIATSDSAAASPSPMAPGRRFSPPASAVKMTPVINNNTNNNKMVVKQSRAANGDGETSFHFMNMSDYQPPSVFRSNAFLDEIDELLRQREEAPSSPQRQSAIANPTSAGVVQTKYNELNSATTTTTNGSGFARQRKHAFDESAITSQGVAARLLRLHEQQRQQPPPTHHQQQQEQALRVHVDVTPPEAVPADEAAVRAQQQIAAASVMHQQQQLSRPRRSESVSNTIITSSSARHTNTVTGGDDTHSAGGVNMAEWAKALLRDRKERAKHPTGNYLHGVSEPQPSSNVHHHHHHHHHHETDLLKKRKEKPEARQQQQRQKHLSERHLEEHNNSRSSEANNNNNNNALPPPPALGLITVPPAAANPGLSRSLSLVSASGSTLLPM